MPTEVVQNPSANSEPTKARWEEPCIEIEYSLVAQAQAPNDDDPLAFVGPMAVS